MNSKLRTVQDVLRHYLVSLAYRFRHVTAGAPEGFGDFEAGAGVRTPRRLVRHMTVLITFVHRQFEDLGTERLEPLDWPEEVERFLAAVAAFDLVLARELPLRNPELTLEQLWQGQLIDAMTHIGQLASLRRLAGAPIDPVRYWRVEMPALNDPPK